MVQRYASKIMNDLWSLENKYKTWLLVELLALEGYAQKKKEITQLDLKNMWDNAEVDVSRIAELEKITHHDFIAFTSQIAEKLGSEKKWLHYGLTSTDVVDTAQSVILQKVNIHIKKVLKKFIESVRKLAIKHKMTFQIGRTHGMHAEVSTFGYKVAVWYDEMTRNIKRFQYATKNIEIAKISGAVGNYANIPLLVQEHVAKKSNLTSAIAATQVLQRDRHAEYLFAIASIGNSLDKFATEIRHLQRTEVGEVQEFFHPNQKGSSAMPHKQNPIASENISGCARLLRGFVLTAMENTVLWHERDISHSSAERFILEDATSTIYYMLTRFTSVIDKLVVNEQKMKENIFLTSGAVFSQKAMLKAIQLKNWTREKTYSVIQPLAHQAFNEKRDFKKLLIKKKIFTAKEIEDLYNLEYYTKNIDKIFHKLHLLEKENFWV